MRFDHGSSTRADHARCFASVWTESWQARSIVLSSFRYERMKLVTPARLMWVSLSPPSAVSRVGANSRSSRATRIPLSSRARAAP